MYWNQLIEFHKDLRLGGAPAHEVVESLAKAKGISLQDAMREVESAVMMGDLYYVRPAPRHRKFGGLGGGFQGWKT